MYGLSQSTHIEGMIENVSIVVRHLSRKLNTFLDYLSRDKFRGSKWKVDVDWNQNQQKF